MTDTRTEPIVEHWTITELGSLKDDQRRPSALDVNQCLGRLEVVDIEERLVPFLAAAAAEMALEAGIPWQFSADDPAVALLRLIAKVASTTPHAGGPHTDRLLTQLS